MPTTKLSQTMVEILILGVVALFPCSGATGVGEERNRAKHMTSPPISKTDPNDRTVMGQVVDPNGQPLAQIPIVTYGYHKRETVTGKEGRFTFKLPYKYQHPAGCLIVARDKQRNLAVFADYIGQDSCIVMKLEPAVILEGKICDTQGNGIPNARLMLYWQLPGCGYEKWEDVTLDKQGRFDIRAIPYGRRYFVDVSAEGYGRGSTSSIDTNARKARIRLPPIVLRTADQSVGGIVIDPLGNPVADAEVHAGGEGQPWCQIQSDKQGRFLLKGVCAGDVSLRGEHTDGQILMSGEIKVQAGDMNVSLALNERSLLESSVPDFESLIGKALPNITDLGLSEKQIDAANRRILICCFDTQQRPARRCVIQLAEQAEQLKQKGVVVVIVQASKVDENKIKDWIKENNIPFPAGMIKGNPEEIRFTWGVKSLPWLILTDKQHVVREEGFALSELDEKLNANK